MATSGILNFQKAYYELRELHTLKIKEFSQEFNFLS